jgi:hypothetical protein
MDLRGDRCSIPSTFPGYSTGELNGPIAILFEPVEATENNTAWFGDVQDSISKIYSINHSGLSVMTVSLQDKYTIHHPHQFYDFV